MFAHDACPERAFVFACSACRSGNLERSNCSCNLKTDVGSMADFALHALTRACSGFCCSSCTVLSMLVGRTDFIGLPLQCFHSSSMQNHAHIPLFKHYLSGHTLRWVTGSLALFLGSVIGSTLVMLGVCCAGAHAAVALLRSHCGCFAQHDMPVPCTAFYN